MRATERILVGPAAHLLMLAIEAADDRCPCSASCPERVSCRKLVFTARHTPAFTPILGLSCKSDTARFTNANSGYSATV